MVKLVGFVHHTCILPLVQVEFQSQLTKIHEQSRLREEEIEGQWATEDKMLTEWKYSKLLGL